VAESVAFVKVERFSPHGLSFQDDLVRVVDYA